MYGLTSYRAADISIVVTAHNEERYIERCLRSLRNLEALDFSYNIVLVDDGSEDRTAELVERYFPDIIFLKSSSNSGLPASINKGILESSTQYIVRVDGDDYVDRRFLSWLYYTISTRPDFEAVSCDYYKVDSRGARECHVSATKEPIGCGILFRRDVLVELGLYDREFRAREEQELMSRFKASGFNLLNLPVPLYRYRQHVGSITKDKDLMEKYELKLREKQ